jgi:serine phosphatase RsbU (regulator of sigma subunit)
MKYRFSFLLLLIIFAANAQKSHRLDSMLRVLSPEKDTVRAMTLSEIAFEYRESNPDLSKKYVNEAIALSYKLNYSAGIYDATMEKALLYKYTGQRDSVEYYLFLAKEKANEINRNTMRVSVYSNLANFYSDEGNNKLALAYYDTVSSLTDRQKDPKRYAYLRVNIATIYSDLKQADSALGYYQEAIQILEKNDPNNINLPIVYNNLGATYLELGDTAKAELEFFKVLRLATLAKQIYSRASAYEHLGIITFSKELYDSSFALLHLALTLHRNSHAMFGISSTCNTLGTFFYERHQYDSAIFYLKQGAFAANQIRDLYRLDDYYKTLSLSYEKLGKLDSALHYQRKAETVKDSLYNLNKSNVVSEAATAAQNDRRKHEIELLNEAASRKAILMYAIVAISVLVLLLLVIAVNRYRVKKKSNDLLEKRNDEIENQKSIIEEKNKDITDSIRYAQRIQNAILPTTEKMKDVFPESWCCFIPKDIVSGDFYFFEKSGDYSLFAVVDCTGHGVPGALLSVVGHNLLSKAITDLNLTMPDQILTFMNSEINHLFRNNRSQTGIKDGMDIAICTYHAPSQTAYFSGALNSLYHFRNGICTVYKPDKIALGTESIIPAQFTRHTIPLNQGDQIVLFSDGYADQFGGSTGKKLKYKPFRELLQSVISNKMDQQGAELEIAFEKWKLNYEQVDDVCVASVKI